MSESRLLSAIHEIEEGWTWLYTAGMPVDRSERRREEVRSDAWDHATWAFRSGQRRFGTIGQAISRFVLGIPSDIGWRLSSGRAGVSREAAVEGGLAALIVIGLAVALPLAPMVLADQYAHTAESESVTTGFAVYVVMMTLTFGGLGVLAMDRFPVAGGTLVLIGCAGLGVVVWFIPFASSLCLAGAVAAVCAMARSRSGRPATRDV